MTGKVPFPELDSPGAITLTVIQGGVPSPVEHAQLAQIVALCNLMTDCWAFDPKDRLNASRCCDELKWMVRTALALISTILTLPFSALGASITGKPFRRESTTHQHFNRTE